MTEQEMRDFKVPFFDTLDEVVKFIRSLETQADDYGTAAYCASLAAMAAFNYICHREGLTGFQASCADLDIIRRNRSINGPFIILKLDDYMFPQYDIEARLREFIDSNKTWIKEEADRKLKETEYTVHPDVEAHWKRLSQL